MSYLKKNERYQQILNTAMQVVIDEGIAAITARKIAKTANISVGLIHKHFKTIGELKSIALIAITNQLIEQQQTDLEHKTHIDKIIESVIPLKGNNAVIFRKMWNEALFLSDKDPDIKRAYQSSTNEWHEYIVQLINEAVADNALQTNSANDLAWRLIAISCGFDNLSIIDEFDQSTIYAHILALLPPNLT
ncbi:TetR family transcriptional regulator [Orbus hercynius]|uniref:TetR family transcriptional regulator n=1 Tax=Orbus hercynius TaxID=593135 RepID=A0A495RBF7_9GAMM|nr:TetR family transcriptional regulator [Orbus hercynius]RKS84812.1 TetR family transcriptional regulator [Orbus hercynius]